MPLTAYKSLHNVSESFDGDADFLNKAPHMRLFVDYNLH